VEFATGATVGSGRHQRVTAGGDGHVTAGGDRAGVDLNRWFDRVPRLTIDVGHRRLPAFRSLGILGFQVAVVVAVLVSLVNGVPLITALGLSAVAGISFFVWGLLRRAVTGRETLVQIEYVWVALGAVVGFLWVAGGPILAGIDVMAVALCAFLAFGRLGCASVGCCHGVLARVGIAYGREHGLAPRFTGRRLLPVQLVEAGGLVLIGAVGLALAGGQPGRPTVWFLAAYAALRFGCEAVRGDERPTVLGISVPRLMCLAQVAVAVVVAEAFLVPGPPGRAVVAGGVALAVAAACGLGLSAVRCGNPLVAPAHVDEMWALVSALAPRAYPTEPLVARTSRDMALAVTRNSAGVHVSMSHPKHATFPVGIALHPDDVVERGGVTHVALWTEAALSPGGPQEDPTPWAGIERATAPVGGTTAPADAGYFGGSHASGTVPAAGHSAP
jgi:hypothetical protein